MSGTLYVVATPIGNLEDITLRALKVLRTVAVVAAEDTRRTARLLTHYDIRNRTTSFHEHNARTRVPSLLSLLENGKDVALVSDAGTPLMSDPGLELVQACLSRGFAVDPIPGPSALLTALIGSGLPTNPVTFLGFPPARSIARSRWFQALDELPHTVVFFEAPHRISTMVTELGKLSVDRPISVGRELTKLHQQFIRQASLKAIAELSVVEKGEFTIVLGPHSDLVERHNESAGGDLVMAEFGRMTRLGMSRRESIRQLALKYGRRSKDIYSMLEESKRSSD